MIALCDRLKVLENDSQLVIVVGCSETNCEFFSISEGILDYFTPLRLLFGSRFSAASLLPIV